MPSDGRGADGDGVRASAALRVYNVCSREIWKCVCWVGLHRSWVHERQSVSCYRRGRQKVRCSNR